MRHTHDIQDLVAHIDVGVEPPMRTSATDIARLGRRRLVRRRATAGAAGAFGIALVATATTLLLPGTGLGTGDAAGTSVASGSLPRDSAPAAPAAPSGDIEPEGDGFAYPVTRTALLTTAQEHLDPTGEHLPASLADVRNLQSRSGEDSAAVGTKLAWAVAGEPGLGVVRVEVTSSGYTADADDLALFTATLGCDIGASTCTEGVLPGTDLRVWVAEDTADVDLAVVLERADGSLVALAASALFGNNSTVSVPEVAITRDQAFAFVADPDVVIDAEERASYTAPGGGDPTIIGPERTSTEPAP